MNLETETADLEGSRMSKKMITKIIAAFAVIAVVIPPLYMSGTLLHLLMIFVAGVGSYEVAR